MNLRFATTNDLNKLENMYSLIVDKMVKSCIEIWNEYYPFEEFEEDIANNRLYVLAQGNDICAAFALLNKIDGSSNFVWEKNNANALYISRLGVNINYLRQGVGTAVIQSAVDICRERGIEYLRLTVAEENIPAIKLYLKNNFHQVAGKFEEFSPALNRTITEYGLELKIK